MFHSRQLNNQINKIHERALRQVYKDNKLTFNDLVKLDNSVAIHQRKLQILATEIFKVKINLAPEIMTEVFEIKEPYYNLVIPKLVVLREKTWNLLIMVFNLCDIYLGPKIWNRVPQNIRESNSLNEFKSLIKFWKPDTCPCRLCQKDIAQVGFIWSYIHRNICLSFSNYF